MLDPGIKQMLKVKGLICLCLLKIPHGRQVQERTYQWSQEDLEAREASWAAMFSMGKEGRVHPLLEYLDSGSHLRKLQGPDKGKGCLPCSSQEAHFSNRPMTSLECSLNHGESLTRG